MNELTVWGEGVPEAVVGCQRVLERKKLRNTDLN